jgi:hypothetical protein
MAKPGIEIMAIEETAKEATNDTLVQDKTLSPGGEIYHMVAGDTENIQVTVDSAGRPPLLYRHPRLLLLPVIIMELGVTYVPFRQAVAWMIALM